MVTAAPILRISDVTRAFAGLQVLRGVCLEIEAGSITGLIGPNGSGKSTLFDIITRYLRADSGDIVFSGESIGRLAPHEVSRRGLIRTFQLTRIFHTMTVAENLLVFADRKRYAGDVSGEDKALELLEFMGLMRVAHDEAAGLSYGQQKLLEIAQVLMLEPTLMMLDEPMAGINPGLADELVDRLRQLRAGGMTILLVEHNLPLLSELCDQLAVLNEGRVMARGTPADVLADADVRGAFLGG